MMAELYHKAEAQVRIQNKKNQKSKAGKSKSKADAQRLVHELQVHHVQLEMQNAELHEARDRMEALLEKYTDLYDFAPVGYFSLAESGAINQVNLAGAWVIGVERARLVGRPFGLLISPELRPVFNSFLKQVFANQTKQSGDFELLRQGQPPRIVNVEAQRLVNGLECRVAVLDITERKRVEEALRESEERFRAFVTASSDVVYRMSSDWSEMRLLHGRNFIVDTDKPSRTWLQKYIHPDDHSQVMAVINKAIRTRTVFQMEHKVRRRDGTLGWTFSRAVPLLDAQGKIVEWFGAASDVTERKRTEAALHESEERFRAAVGIVSSLIWTNNAKGLMEGEQPGWSDFTGQTLKEYQGYGWAKAVHPQDAPPTIAAWKQAVAKKKLFEFEHRVRRRDGEWRLCSVRAVPLLGADGRIREWVGVHTDITDRKLAEAAQRRLAVMTASNRKLEQEIVRRQAVEEALQKSEQHQRQLLEESRQLQEQLRRLSRQVLQAQEEERKRISRELHDVIAQTLTSINLRLATLKKEATVNTKSLERTITRTQQLVEHSVDIVHKFARELRPTVLDDLGLIPALHTFLKSFKEQTGIHVSLSAFAAVEQVNGDKRTVLYRIAQEALTNVARHAHASRVDVTIQKLGDALCMKIKDDGQGFPAERALQTKKNERLGLLGMRERLEMIGGKFTIESAPGKGATIIAQIPFGKAARGGRKTR